MVDFHVFEPYKCELNHSTEGVTAQVTTYKIPSAKYLSIETCVIGTFLFCL